jgi:hypothetical protein
MGTHSVGCVETTEFVVCRQGVISLATVAETRVFSLCDTL